jgi:hypothetical protein
VALHIVTVTTLFLHLLVASLNLTLSLSPHSLFLDIKFAILEAEDLSSSMMIIQPVNDFLIPLSPPSPED